MVGERGLGTSRRLPGEVAREEGRSTGVSSRVDKRVREDDTVQIKVSSFLFGVSCKCLLRIWRERGIPMVVWDRMSFCYSTE